MVEPSTSALNAVTSALNEYRKLGYQYGITALSVLLSPALLLQSQPLAALEVVEHGLAVADRNQERVFEAELRRLKAKVLLTNRGDDARTEAKSLLDQALNIARAQNARSLELRAAADLSALWIEEGGRERVVGLLAPLRAKFTEGFDTLDLKQTSALLDQVR